MIMWPFTPFGDQQEGSRHPWAEEAPEGAVSRPLFWLGSVFLGGQSGQDPHAERAPLL